MKNLFKVIMIVAFVTIIGFSTMSCATSSTIGSAAGPLGFFTGNKAAAATTEGYTPVASYSVICGIIDTEYPAYATAVANAESSGKQIITVTKSYFNILLQITAYAK
jgi:Na+-transporting methylmalonyl-CoA/oxaloacetate decarboxylase beta subunit